jgi:hypothetical protein
MSAQELYQEVRGLIGEAVGTGMDESSLERLVLLVLGVLAGKSASPARIAAALRTMGLSEASEASIERRIRRTVNDPELTAAVGVHRFARWRLALGRPKELRLIMDPTSQDERVVLLTVAVWYRGRSLPLCWSAWAANVPLEGAGFWQRVGQLLTIVKELLPPGIPIIWLADRAFGTPAFTDQVVAHGWHYIVRVQGQTRCQDQPGRLYTIGKLVAQPGQRRKLRGQVFKKQEWRQASVVVFWGGRHRHPLCLVSDLPADWTLIALYRQRFPIEATFRDFKSYGWQWESGQVSDLNHICCLLIAMALAAWLAIALGSQVAAEFLAKKPTGRRRTLPREGKRSLFQLGLQRFQELRAGLAVASPRWLLTDWDAPNWQRQLYFHHARAFVFAR